MLTIVAKTIARFKLTWGRELEEEATCRAMREAGHTWRDSQVYTAEKLAEAYGLRWTIETSFAHFKTTMKMDVLRCQTVRGILKELTMFLLVYNLVRVTMVEADQQQGGPVDRISFVDTLRWLATTQHPEILPTLTLVPFHVGFPTAPLETRSVSEDAARRKNNYFQHAIVY